MLLKVGEKVIWRACQRSGCRICSPDNIHEKVAREGVFVVKSAWEEGDGEFLVSVEPWAPSNIEFHVDDTFESSNLTRFYERHLTPIGGMPVDRILNELMKAVEGEEEAQRALWDAKNKTQTVVRDNLKELVNTGVIKISVDKKAVTRLMGRPSEKR